MEEVPTVSDVLLVDPSNGELKEKMYKCYDNLFNCAIVILPSMFVLPIFLWSLERLNLVTVPSGSRLETILNYYFVICWATMFVFSFLFCAKSLCDIELRTLAWIANTEISTAGNTTTEGTSSAVVDMSHDCPNEFTSMTSPDLEDGSNDLPPSYEEATGKSAYVTVP